MRDRPRAESAVRDALGRRAECARRFRHRGRRLPLCLAAAGRRPARASCAVRDMRRMMRSTNPELALSYEKKAI